MTNADILYYTYRLHHLTLDCPSQDPTPIAAGLHCVLEIVYIWLCGWLPRGLACGAVEVVHLPAVPVLSSLPAFREPGDSHGLQCRATVAVAGLH